jgi:hypothetical protein
MQINSASGSITSDGGAQAIGASDGNQAALESRFQQLYVAMMEKQISFKEATEPFRTDNQNAGKG